MNLQNTTSIMQLYYLLSFIIVMETEAGLRVLGGRDALKDEFPYAIRIEYQPLNGIRAGIVLENTFLCTGAALQPTWLLTAAHCMDPEYVILLTNDTKFFVRYNSHFPDYLGKTSRILEYYRYPGYGTKIKRNDIGLFRCEKISLSVYGKVSAVDFRTLVGHEVFSLGYGRTNATATTKPLQVLQGVLNKCRADVEKGFLCLNPRCGLVATICGGDSGGPVVHSSGIVGVNCMSADTCNEYTTFLVPQPGTEAAVIATLSPRMTWLSNMISNSDNNPSINKK